MNIIISQKDEVKKYISTIKKLRSNSIKAMCFIGIIWIMIIIYPWFNFMALTWCLLGFIFLVYCTGVLAYNYDSTVVRKRESLLKKMNFIVSRNKYKLYINIGPDRFEVVRWIDSSSEIKIILKEKKKFRDFFSNQ